MTDNPNYKPDDFEAEEDVEEEEFATGEEEEETPEPADEDEPEEEELPEKFKGKSAAEIAKSYRELESTMHSRVQQEALKMAQSLMKGDTKVDAQAAKEVEEEDDIELSDEEISKMKPRDFIKFVNKQATERARKIVAKTIEQQNEARQNVQNEIKEVTKLHPHIKENKHYREVVIDMIDAASARGKKLSLKDACKRADEAFGIKPGEKKPEEAKPKKKLRTGVEKTRGTDGAQNKTDEDLVKEGILNAGGKSTGLGGLGI